MVLAQYEQLKKLKAKSNKAGAGKKKEAQAEPTEEVAPTKDDIQRDNGKDAPKAERGEDEKNDSIQEKDEDDAEGRTEISSPVFIDPQHKRQPSLSVQSRMRSSSFRRSSSSQVPLSPGANGTKSPELPILSPDGDSVNSIYRKQAARLDELERENRSISKEAQEAEKKWRKTEEELEELREASGEVAELKSKAQKLDALIEELNKVVSRVSLFACYSLVNSLELKRLIETRQ